MTDQGVSQLQHWMKEVITTQGSMMHKLQRAGYLFELNEHEVVAATRDVSIYTRLNVYTSGYVMRLVECINADFPVLRGFMGEEVFSGFANASLMWSPSTSYTLYDLGNNFIKFLEATRPTRSEEPDDEDAFLDLPIEIARAERARQETIRSHGMEGKTKPGMDFFPGHILFNTHRLKVSVPPCLRLLELKFPLKHLIETIHNEEDFTMPEPKKTYMAISRVNYRLTMEELHEWQYRLLEALMHTTSLNEAIDSAANKVNTSSATLLADLSIILTAMLQNGFLIIEELEGVSFF